MFIILLFPTFIIVIGDSGLIAISPNRTSPPRLAYMMVRLFKIPISCDGSLALKIHKSNCHLKQSLLLQQRIFDGLIFEDLIKRKQLEY